MLKQQGDGVVIVWCAKKAEKAWIPGTVVVMPIFLLGSSLIISQYFCWFQNSCINWSPMTSPVPRGFGKMS